MKLLKSFGYALKGLQAAISSQVNLKIHLLAAVVVTAAGFYFHVSASDWVMLIFAMALVISLELINTAIETLTDLISPERHALAGRAKDIAAAAVFVASIAALITGILIFSKYIKP